ncbi:MAG: hypothetical protein SYC29_12830 [Planctomycetota bacterium]|nr:hypothetical protein [Planctomycetota bacterium]
MCYILFLGSDVPLPTSAWRKEAPAFFLSDTDPGSKVKRHFSTSHVYYAGSHEGCGCGFFYDQEDDPEEYEIRKASVRDLVSAIQLALRSAPKVELLVTWTGDEKKPPKRRLNMLPHELLGTKFPLDENDFVTIMESDEQTPRGDSPTTSPQE